MYIMQFIGTTYLPIRFIVDRYLVHCHGPLVSKFAVIGAPHPNVYWQYPPAEFCDRALHFIQVDK